MASIFALGDGEDHHSPKEQAVADLHHNFFCMSLGTNYFRFHAPFRKIWLNNRLAPLWGGSSLCQILDPPLTCKSAYNIEQISFYQINKCTVGVLAVFLNVIILHYQVIQIETRDLRDTDTLSASLLELNLEAPQSHHKGARLINTTQQDEESDDATEKSALRVPTS